MDPTDLVLNMPDAMREKLYQDLREKHPNPRILTPEILETLVKVVLAGVNSPFVRRRLKPKTPAPPPPAQAPAPAAKPTAKPVAKAPAAQPEKAAEAPADPLAGAVQVDQDFKTKFPVTKDFPRITKLAQPMEPAFVFKNETKTEVLLRPKAEDVPEAAAVAGGKAEAAAPAGKKAKKPVIFAPPARAAKKKAKK